MPKLIKSPLRYPGGKSRAVKTICQLVPEYQEYREPFLGGGSMYVYLKQKYPKKTYWVNDIYYELFCFWKASQENTNDMLKYIIEWKESYQEGKKLHRFLLDNLASFDEIQTAAAFFVLNRITFSGTTESGGYSNQAFLKRFTPSSIERVKQLSNVLGNTTISNVDYSQLVETTGKNVFLFLDPPYYSATKSALYGKKGKLHKDFNHERFAETMKDCSHKWLITYDNHPYIKKLFSFAHIFTWDITYGMRNVSENGQQKEKELFISNYTSSLPQKKQLALFEN